MIDENTVSVELNEEEAALFVWMRSHADKINILRTSGALDTKNGSITLNFDNNATLMLVTSNRVEFKRTKLIGGAIVQI